MNKLIKLNTELETVYINPENIISYEILKVFEDMNIDGEIKSCPFFEISFITKHRIYKDENLYAEISEIEKEYNLI